MILLLTHSGDYYTIDRVKMALDERNARSAIVHTDRYPQFCSLTSEFRSNDPVGFSAQLEDKFGPVNLNEVGSVWVRRIWPGLMPPDMPPQAAAQQAKLSHHAYNETLDLLRDAWWMNPIDAGLKSESKSLQLKVASQTGLRIPDTLISNDPDRIRDFFHRHGGNIITKTLQPLAVSMEAAPEFAYTCRVEAEQLDMLDVARLSPQIYQPCIEKAWELRVAVVCDRFFVAGIRGKGGTAPGLDWRSPTHGECEWFESTLPDDSREKLLKLMERLGIVFGSADFIVDDPEGEPVFLEINQAGEWGMLERDLGFPIAKTIADKLIENSKA
ncbi:MAG: MvdC/MvdD family ATP grasp protein [Planctomycetota bacterium]